MSSSTSSSEARRDRVRLLDRRVALGVLLMVVALEVFTRVRLFSMSKDFRRFRGYDARAAALVARGGTRVALIGNSATDRGVDVVTLERALAGDGQRVHADLFVADQSRVNTWRYMLESYFARAQRRPDLVVVTFYEDELADGNPVEIGRLAQFFTTVRDWPEVFRVDLPAPGDRVEFVLSSVWATFAASERIRERLLDAVVPDFRDYTARANQIAFVHRRAAAGRASGPRTYRALGGLLQRAAETGQHLCFVAYPTLAEPGAVPYPIPPELPVMLHEAGAGFIDLRRTPGLRPDLYADEVHLTEEGRVPYSAALGQALAAELGRTPIGRIP
jgi:hypothetical protein